MLSLLLAGALAAPATDAAVSAAIDAMYGRPIPAAAICTHAAQLPSAFSGEPVAVAVKRGDLGCVLVGVMVGAELVPVEDAAARSVGASLSSAKERDRAAWLGEWTEQVLLAFDQIEGRAVGAAQPGGGVKVTATFWQRIDEPGGAAHTEGSFWFAADGRLESSNRDGGERFRTQFFVRPDLVESIPDAVIHDTLEQQGKTLRACFDTAWRADMTLQGVVRLQWTLTGGVVSDLAMVGNDGAPETLGACYGGVVRRVAFPADTTGKVRWSFSAVRQPL